VKRCVVEHRILNNETERGVLKKIHFPVSLEHSKWIENINVYKRTEAGSHSRVYGKREPWSRSHVAERESAAATFQLQLPPTPPGGKDDV